MSEQDKALVGSLRKRANWEEFDPTMQALLDDAADRIEALTAAKDAEAVAWIWRHKASGVYPQVTMEDLRGCFGSDWTVTPFYAHPPSPPTADVADKERMAALEAENARLRAFVQSIQDDWIENTSDGDDFDEGYDDCLSEYASRARTTLENKQ